MEIIISTVAKILLGAAITWLWQQHKALKEIRAGLQALLRDRIIQGYNHYCIDKHWIPIYAKDSLITIANAYHALGANGVMNDLIDQIRELPNFEQENVNEKDTKNYPY